MSDLEDKTRLEIQHRAIDEAQDTIEEREEHVAGRVYDGLVDGESLHPNDAISRYLEGYGDALAWAGDQVEGIHRLRDDQSRFDYDPGRIEDESVSQWMSTLLTEAISGNLGNVYANIPSLIDALDVAQEGDPPRSVVGRRAKRQARTLRAHTEMSVDEIAARVPDNPHTEDPYAGELIEKLTEDIDPGSGNLPFWRADE